MRDAHTGRILKDLSIHNVHKLDVETYCHTLSQKSCKVCDAGDKPRRLYIMSALVSRKRPHWGFNWGKREYKHRWISVDAEQVRALSQAITTLEELE